MSGEPFDLDCLARARAGEPRAFRVLYERYADTVFRFLRRMLGEDAAAEDALQETFMRVLAGLRRFDPAGPARLSTWMLTIARRVALSREQSAGRSRRRETAVGAMIPEAVPADERGELRRALEAAIGALPAPQRSVFVLRECHAMSYEEIAAVEEIDVGTVKSRLHRARLALQAALRDQLTADQTEDRRARRA